MNEDYILFTKENKKYFYDCFNKIINTDENEKTISYEVFDQSLTNNSINDKTSFIVLSNERPLGLFLSSARNNTAYISVVGVAKEFRRQGFGRQILENGLMLIKKECETVLLTVGHTNTEALGLYTKCGFEITHEIRSYRCENNAFYKKGPLPDGFSMKRQNDFTYHFLYNVFQRDKRPWQKTLDALLQKVSSDSHELYIISHGTKTCGYLLIVRGNNYIDILDIGLYENHHTLLPNFLSHIHNGERIFQAHHFYETDPLCAVFEQNGFYIDLKQFEMERSTL